MILTVNILSRGLVFSSYSYFFFKLFKNKSPSYCRDRERSAALENWLTDFTAILRLRQKQSVFSCQTGLTGPFYIDINDSEVPTERYTAKQEGRCLKNLVSANTICLSEDHIMGTG